MKSKTTYIIFYILAFFTPVQSLIFKLLGATPLTDPMILAILYMAFGLAGLWIYRDAYAKSWRSFCRKPKDHIKRILIVYLYSAFTVAIIAMVARLPLSSNQASLEGMANRMPLWTTLLALGVCGPITEEIVYREWIFSQLKDRLPLWLVSLVSTLAFAAIHVLGGDLASLLFYLPLSAAFVWLYTRKSGGGIFASTAGHALRNTIATLVLHYALQNL